jgi:hypothetical protein
MAERIEAPASSSCSNFTALRSGGLFYLVGQEDLATYRLPYDAEAGRQTGALVKIDDPATNIVGWSPDGRWLVYGSRQHEGDFVLIDEQTGASRLLSGGKKGYGQEEWFPDSRRIMTGGGNRSFVYDVFAGAIVDSLEVAGLAPTQDGAGVYHRDGYPGDCLLRRNLGSAESESLGCLTESGLSGRGIGLAYPSPTNGDVLLKGRHRQGDSRWASLILWEAATGSFRLLREWEGASMGEINWMPDGRSFIYDADREDKPEDHLTSITLERYWLEDGRSEPWLMPEIELFGNRGLAIDPSATSVLFTGRVATGGPKYVIVPGVLDAP